MTAFLKLLDAMEEALQNRQPTVAIARARQVLRYETGTAMRFPAPFAAAREGLGLALMDMGRVSGARIEFERALRHCPSARGYAGLARCLWQTGDHVRQLTLIEHALDLEPDNAVYHTTRGELLLTLGRWTEGFTEVDRRIAYRGFAPVVAELWTGQSLTDKSIIIVQEGGAGDTFMMMRYVPQVKALGARVIVHTLASLDPVVRCVPGVDHVVQLPVAADYWVPLMSLPGRFGTTPETIPPPVRYLELARRTTTWPPKVIGLCWAGGKATKSDPIRSLDLNDLRAVVMSYTATWRSLQYPQPHPSTVPIWARTSVEWLDLQSSWFATMAELVECDLVITVDTGLAHLAATLGIPTWMLTATPTDWRWLLDRDDTAWYPEMRLFRQPRPRDWGAVVQNVVRALGET